MVDILHDLLLVELQRETYPFLEISQLGWGKGIGLSNDWDNVHSGRQSSHELDIHLSQTEISFGHELDPSSLRVPSRLDKVEQSVNSIIPESGVSLDPRLFSQDIIILSFKV
jgi:hypothetical protein